MIAVSAPGQPRDKSCPCRCHKAGTGTNPARAGVTPVPLPGLWGQIQAGPGCSIPIPRIPVPQLVPGCFGAQSLCPGRFGGGTGSQLVPSGEGDLALHPLSSAAFPAHLLLGRLGRQQMAKPTLMKIN